MEYTKRNYRKKGVTTMMKQTNLAITNANTFFWFFIQTTGKELFELL